MVLRVLVPTDSRSTAWCSFDGRNRLELKRPPAPQKTPYLGSMFVCILMWVEGDYVAISASRFLFPTVLKQKEAGDWFDSISRTLNWNERKRQKKFDDPADAKLLP
jgi:NAD+ kinase